MDSQTVIRATKDKKTVEKFRLIISFGLLLVGFWQLEIIYISQPLGWAFNFAGLGSFGLPLFIWRDFFYALIFLAWLMKPIKRIDLVIWHAEPVKIPRAANDA